MLNLRKVLQVSSMYITENKKFWYLVLLVFILIVSTSLIIERGQLCLSDARTESILPVICGCHFGGASVLSSADCCNVDSSCALLQLFTDDKEHFWKISNNSQLRISTAPPCLQTQVLSFERWLIHDNTTGRVCVMGGPSAHHLKANRQARLLERKVCFDSDAGNWGRVWWTSVQRLTLHPLPPQARDESFYS